MLELLFGIAALLILLTGGFVAIRLGQLAQTQRELLGALSIQQEEKHRAMLQDLHAGLQRQSDALGQGFAEQGERLRNSLQESGDRLRDSVAQSAERLREAVSNELRETRQGLDSLSLRQTESLQAAQLAQTAALQAMQLAQTQALAEGRELMAKQLSEISLAIQDKQDTLRRELLELVAKQVGEQGRAQQELLLNTLRRTTEQLTQTITQMSEVVDKRLEQISGKVSERLDEGFKKTNETFVSVMARLATIDEAQKKIDGLTTNVVSLQELLGDKRSRGAFGEVQLEHLISNVLPASCYQLQATLSNGARADCILRLPEPTGTVAVDSKFPLENYHRMFSAANEAERTLAQRQFKADVKKHVDAIGDKYIVAGETADGAVMFIPAEAVFAEIHAYHPELVQYAMGKRVWIVSPTTMMAVLNTARAVIKDVETRRQVHIIKDALGKLSKEFGRFDQRMKKLADHIRMAHEDAQQVQLTSEKISRRFDEIEHVRLDDPSEVPQPAGALALNEET
ncbi:DNA recombination protein RmuC [Chitinimonas sp. BJYL2]|uniref:DNA recombination protein RmuC n=1 Tax=Chitinimonas sp. BJYL2 TaxID=2976696 RepID=UPI0022B2B042|nr:DNA recombination protein RmuC [Chitinimonas sp. BJYL2]